MCARMCGAMCLLSALRACLPLSADIALCALEAVVCLWGLRLLFAAPARAQAPLALRVVAVTGLSGNPAQDLAWF